MKLEELISSIDTLSQFTKSSLPILKFTFNRPFTSSENKPFSDWCFSGWPNYMPDKESGVYFICWPKDEVVYIGKATKDNLGAEIWGKFGKPCEDANSKKIFSKSYYLTNKNMKRELKDNCSFQNALLNGEVFIATVIIPEKDIASLVEVYLQTVHKKIHGELPILNKQIG